MAYMAFSLLVNELQNSLNCLIVVEKNKEKNYNNFVTVKGARAKWKVAGLKKR